MIAFQFPPYLVCASEQYQIPMLHCASRPLKRSRQLAELQDDHRDLSRTSPNYIPGYPNEPSRKRSRRDLVDAPSILSDRWAIWPPTSAATVYSEDAQRFMMDVDDSDYDMTIVAAPPFAPNTSCFERANPGYVLAPSDAAATIKTQNSDSERSSNKFNMLPLLFPRGRFIRRRISASLSPMDRHDEIDSEEGD